MDGQDHRTHLSIKQVAERWGVSVNFVRRQIWAGKLNATRFGRAIRISIKEVEAFADEHTDDVDEG